MRPVTVDLLEEVNKRHAISITAMFNMLIEKGIITFEEFTKAKAVATHEIDQLSAEQRDQHEQEQRPSQRAIMAAYELGRLHAKRTARGE